MNNEIDYKKRCNVCNIEKLISEFYFRKENNKYRDNCKKCKPVINREFWAKRQSKVCKICGEEKSLSEYQKATGGSSHQPYCKPCDSERKKQYVQKNLEKVLSHRKEYHLKTKDTRKPKIKEYYENHKREVYEYQKKYSAENRDKINERARKLREKRRKKVDQAEIEAKKIERKNRKREARRIWCNKMSATNIEFRILKNLRSRTRFALKKQPKSDTTENLLGCSVSFFKDYFSSLFTDGMTWDLFMDGEIHIDHIKPCSKFDLTKEEQQRECFNYKNLQPLWKLDNLKKGVKDAA